MKKILVAVLALVLLTAGVSAAFFEKTVDFADGTFSDVAANAWYAKDVQSSYEFGLVNGVGGGKFDPNGTVTVAQAVALATRFNAAYNNKTIGTGGDKWYSANVDYAVKNGIMTATQFDNYDRAAKRHEVATLFAASLPEEYFKPFNTVFSIPDVPADKPYHKALMTLYKAGIAMGSDAKGTFNPDSNITRAEFSALINRVAAPGNRLAKTFDKMPREDSYMLIDAMGMGYDFDNQRFINIPSGWVVDNKNMENSTNGQVGRVVGDQNAEDYVLMFKDIDEVKSGRLLLEYYGNMSSKDDGLYIGFADDKNNLKATVKTDFGVFALAGSETVKTDIKVATENADEYIILMTVDFDNDEMYAYINGVKTPVAKLPADLAVSRFILGSTKQGTGYMSPTHIRLYQNYAYVDRFLVPETEAGKAPDSMNTYGNFAVEEYPTVFQEDKYSVKVDAKAGSENIASRGFAGISEKGIFESFVLLPEGTNGAYFTVTSANSDVVKIYSKDGAWYVGDKKMRDFTENVWQILRIETDTAAKKAVIKICGKIVGEVAISAQYIDGVKIGFNPDKDGVMWFDDITAYNYIDHADYPAAPKANNKDDYNIGIHVCSLWHDTTTQEGWQVASPFAELEPWLGFYDEGSPELADWEIKIMAEHGIDFQHFCWYQPQKPVETPIKVADSSQYAMHDGYMNAKYSDMVKFAIMWENANSPKSSLEHFKEYIWNYWKEYYFSDPRYMTIENKPVLSVWTYADFKNFFGGVEGAKEALEFMREDIKTLGYDGLIFLVKSSKSASEIGADAGYFYHYSQDGYSADHQIKTLEGYKDSPLHAIPTLAMGHNGIGRYDYRVPLATMEDHRKAAEYIKNDYLASRNTGTWMDNTLFVSTWNEYTEGHYICPSGEFGYGYLETIKDVFTNDKSDHTALDVKPTDAQKARITKMYDESFQPLRLYRFEDPATDVELKPLVTWDFSKEEDAKRWETQNLSNDGKTEKGIKFHGTTDDPQMYLYDANIDLAKKPVVHVRMKTVELPENRNPSIYLFFTTVESPAMEGSVKFKRVPLQKDGKTHDYYLDLSEINDWSGTLKNMRIDPISAVDPFEIELIELLIPANEEAKVIANGLPMTFDFTATIKDGDVEVTANPTQGFFTMLNLHYTWDRYTGSFHVESKKHSLDMKTGSSKAVYDGKEIDLGYTFNIRDGLPVIKLVKFCELMGHKAELDLEANTLTITSTDRKAISPVKEEYYGWDFDIDGNNEGWHTSDSIVSVGNGKLYLDNPVHFDMHLFSPEVAISSSKYTKLKVGMYADPDEVKGQSFQMFFRASGQSLDEKKSVKHKYDISKMKKGELYEFEIDLAANENWYGIIYDLRIDMFNTVAESAIEYIHFIPNVDSNSQAPEIEKETVTEVKRFDFNDEAQVNLFKGVGVTPKFDNGNIVLSNVESTDPQLYLYNANINASDANAVRIGIRTDKNAMAGKSFQIFFTTDSDKTYDQKKSASCKYDVTNKNDGDLYEVVIDFSNKSAWNGTITNLRFDPFDSKAEAVIDYIVIGKKIEEETKLVATGNMVDPATAPYVYNFDKDDEVKYWGNNGDVGIESGMLTLKNTKSIDVQLYFEEVGIDASKVDSVTVGIKVNKAAMIDNYMQMFFTTEADTKLDAKKSISTKFDLAGAQDGDIIPVTLNVGSKDTWTGTIKKIRLDAFEHMSDVYIDFIAFGKVSGSNAGTQTPAPSAGAASSIKWDFDTEPENVEGNNVIVYVQDGMLVMDEPNSQDIQVYFNKLELDASKCSKFRMGLKVNKAAMNEKTWMNLFFVTNNEKSFDAKKSYTHKFNTEGYKDGDIYEIVIDLKSKDVWKDTVTRLRIDPYDVQAIAYIDYIYIE